MNKVLKLFFGAEGTHPVFLLACLLLANLCQAVGVGTLLPLLSAVGGNNSGHSSLNQSIRQAIIAAGISPDIGNLIVIVVGALILRSVVAFASQGYAALEVAGIATRLRVDLFRSIFAARWSFYADKKLGYLANSIGTDSLRAADAYTCAAQFAASAIECSTYIVLALAIDWRIGLLGSAVGALISTSVTGMLSSTRRAGQRQFARISDLTVLMTDVIGNMKPIKTMDRFAGVLSVVAKKIASLRKVLLKKELARVGLAQASDALAALALGAILYVAVVVMQWPLAELLVMTLLLYQIVAATNRAQKALQTAIEIAPAYWRVRQLIGEAQSELETHSGVIAPRFERSCRFEHVEFSHGESPVIHDVTFEIPAREITVLQGPSGSGKTTIIDLLSGLYVPDQGRITIDGIDINEIDMKAWRRMTGYVPQELTLLHGSVRENISLGDPSIDDGRIETALVRAGASQFVDSLPQGLDTDVGSMGGKLSGGQRQRIALARALVVEPKLLILDEVTSALDPDTEAEICQNIAELRGDYTIVAITHRPAWMRIADRLHKVVDGRVNEIPADPSRAA